MKLLMRLRGAGTSVMLWKCLPPLVDEKGPPEDDVPMPVDLLPGVRLPSCLRNLWVSCVFKVSNCPGKR